jgi:hypothetical protein
MPAYRKPTKLLALAAALSDALQPWWRKVLGR